MLLAADEGELIADRPQRQVRIKADLEQLALTESRYAPGESGPGPHVHREHTDSIWVLEGELAFELGGEAVRAPAGAFVLVPPHVVHTFRNEGPADARFLNFHTPSMGFADHLRAMRDARGDDEMRAASERFDTADPPADGGRPPSDALVRSPGEGEELEGAGGSRAVVKAGREHGAGQLALTETTLAPGFAVPTRDRHDAAANCVCVLEGTLTLGLGDRQVEAAAGTFALAPPGTPNTFSNPGGEPVRLLNAMAPAGCGS